jgi:hypothetical protein
MLASDAERVLLFDALSSGWRMRDVASAELSMGSGEVDLRILPVELGCCSGYPIAIDALRFAVIGDGA